MKTKLLLSALITMMSSTAIIAQDRTIIYSNSTEISDNLDLKAVASIFGEVSNLNDFERKLNDPRVPISNLDLNDDNQVDYLRVIESVEKRTHVVIIQSVLGREQYQDVATIEVEKDNYNNVRVQVVGNEYLYGTNYIYEPVYYRTPTVYASFWTSYYRPYTSSWRWNYYPTYYASWNPYSVIRYQNNINNCVNYNNRYNYANNHVSVTANFIYGKNRHNYYEKKYPKNAFSYRNSSVTNRYELETRRDSKYRNEYGYSQKGKNYSQGNRNSRHESNNDYAKNYTSDYNRNVEQHRSSNNRNDNDNNRGNSENKRESKKVEDQNRRIVDNQYTQRQSASKESTTARSDGRRNYSY